jgi:hypothetical protein
LSPACIAISSEVAGLAHGIEQPSAVADRHHQAEGAVVQCGQQSSGKRLGPALIELGLRVLR